MTAGPLGENRWRWVDLPQDLSNGTAIGAVVLFSRSSVDINQDVLMCTVVLVGGLLN